MKYFFIFLALLVLQTTACKKNHDDCITTTITNSPPGCSGWGIVVNSIKYPSNNIPLEFQHDGIQVCAKYELYEDMRMCPCCGGKWADIKSMKKFVP